MPSTAGDRAPHTAAQADVLRDQNAYFVEVDQRSQHALVENSCAGCHMVSAAAPAEHSYNLGGTNHGFSAGKADWNFFLIEGDGSDGVHNPSFTLEAIEATIAALEAGPPEE